MSKEVNMKKKIILLISILVSIIVYTSLIKADTLFFKVNKDKALKNEEVTLTVDFNNIEFDRFNVKITSSEDVRTLTSEDLQINDIINNEISFDIDKLSSELTRVNFKYKVSEKLNVDDTIVFSCRISEINDEESENEEEKYLVEYVTITVTKEKDENPGGTGHNPPNNNSNNTNNKPNSTTIKMSSNSSKSFSIKTTPTVKYNGSDNNYLNSLSVKNYEFNEKFSRENANYFIKVEKNVKKIKILYKKSNSNAIVTINGNNSLKIGVNKVLITVTSESGLSRVYRIFVTREGASS